MRLTAKERVLLHLLECGRSAEDVQVSSDLAQEGVARGAGIEVRHVPQYVHPLIQEGLVHERRAHVAGIKQRRKVYALTSSGRAAAIRLREQMKTEVVRVRDGEAVRERRLDQALREIGSGASLLEAVRQVQEGGILDLQAARRPTEPGFVEMLSDAVRTTTFVGRRDELAEITREEEGARVFVIRGIPGIGKTALASRACDLVRGRRNLFWHRIRPWDSRATVLAHLGRFLEALDRPGLSSVLKRGDMGLAAEVLRQDLPDTHAVLVLDDAHEASAGTLDVLRMLTEATASAPDVKIMILTRRSLAFYDARDTAIRRVVREIELGGLKPVEAAALLADGGDSSRLVGLARRLAGHPLLIELVRSQRSDLPAAIRNVDRFLEETIYGGLSEAERRTMKAASLYRVPVPRACLLAAPGSSYEALAALRERSLLRFVGDERYEVHDTIRDFFREVLTPTESRTLQALAVGELRGLAAAQSAAGDLVSAVNSLSNAVRLSRSTRQRAEIREALGDVEERIGDLPAALVSYKEAAHVARDPGTVARLHRKLAFALLALGETVSASAEAEEGFRSLGDSDHVERGWLHLARSRMSIAAEDWDDGRDHAEAALRDFRAFQDLKGQAEAVLELAVVQINSPSGTVELASECLEEALRLSEPLADPVLTAAIRVQFANLYAYRMGDADRAKDYLGVIEALPGILADVRSRQSLLMLRGWLNLDLKADFEGAQADFFEALALSRKLHDPITAVMAKHGAALAAAHGGDLAAARRQLEEVASELLARGLAGLSVEALWSAAEICLATDDVPGFLRLAALLKDPALARGLEARPVIARILAGIECLRMGDWSGVHAAFSDAIRTAEREMSPQERPLAAFAHDMYGAALGAMGEHREAAEQDWLAVECAEQSGLEGRLDARPGIMDGIQKSLGRMRSPAGVPAR